MRQSSQNDVNIEALRLLWGRLGAQKSCPKGGRMAKSGLGHGRRRDQDNHFEVLWLTLSQKLVFLEMYENIRKNNVFKGRRSPGAQAKPLALGSKAATKVVRTDRSGLRQVGWRVQISKTRVGRVGWHRALCRSSIYKAT